LHFCYILNAFPQSLFLPERSWSAHGATQIISELDTVSLATREEILVREILTGNIPNFLRQLKAISVFDTISPEKHSITFFVIPEYLAIGSDSDFCFVPLTPMSAQRIADSLHCSLPTARMVDIIYNEAPLKLVPSPIPPSPAMTTVPVFREHNRTVQAQRDLQVQRYPMGTLCAGYKKDVVITSANRLPGHVAIYGWHTLAGRPIQPLYVGHISSWVDYSHGIRLASTMVFVDSVETTISRVLQDTLHSRYINTEGVISNSRYPY
jgi:hypothetical protein